MMVDIVRTDIKDTQQAWHDNGGNQLPIKQFTKKKFDSLEWFQARLRERIEFLNGDKGPHE